MILASYNDFFLLERTLLVKLLINKTISEYFDVFNI